MPEDHIISLKPQKKEPPRIPEPILAPKKKRPLKSYTVIGAILIVAGIGGAWYFGFVGSKGNTAPEVDEAAQQAFEKEVKDVVSEVGKLILLPDGEVPTIATVSDPAKLQEQTFFKDAKVGDKVLLYTKAKKAYLYRPSLHLLIEVAPITTETQ